MEIILNSRYSLSMHAPMLKVAMNSMDDYECTTFGTAGQLILK